MNQIQSKVIKKTNDDDVIDGDVYGDPRFNYIDIFIYLNTNVQSQVVITKLIQLLIIIVVLRHTKINLVHECK